MQSIRIICDLDGTLAPRNEPLTVEMSELIVRVLRRQWSFALLTGRHRVNVESRVVKPLLSLPSVDWLRFASQIQLITCEGANSWRLSPSGTIIADPSYLADFRFSNREQQQLESCLGRQLQLALDETKLLLTEGPEWREDALLVIKVAGDLSQRKSLAGLLESRLLYTAVPIRVGVAGKTTIVIARQELSKRRALAEMLATSGVSCNVFVADEFVAPGNDADTADLEGIIKISVGPNTRLPTTVLCAGTRGPETTTHWLASLLNTDVSPFPKAESLIHYVTESVRRSNTAPLSREGEVD